MRGGMPVIGIRVAGEYGRVAIGSGSGRPLSPSWRSSFLARQVRRLQRLIRETGAHGVLLLSGDRCATGYICLM